MSPGKVARIAAREFASTALTKGFLIGAVIVPLLMLLAIPVIALLVDRAAPPAERGALSVIDRTGAVAELFAQRVAPEAIAARRAGDSGETGLSLSGVPEVPAAGALPGSAGEAPVIRVDVLAPDADAEVAEERVRGFVAQGAEQREPTVDDPLGVLVIEADAVERAPGETDFGGYELFVRPRLDERTVSEIRDSAEWAILEARVAASGLDRAELDRLTTVGSGAVQEITETGRREASFELSLLLPGAFMMLIMIATFTGGQYLLTTTIEEKSSRVVELLLSAVSSVELMSGKILGQMLVGLVLIVVYSSLGLAGLLTFQRGDLVDPLAIVYMLIFFVLAYCMFASLLAAIGAAVNELREAQSLMTPVMLLVITPYLLFLPITRDPDAPYAVALSYVPPINPMIMMLRVASAEPPPTWEILLSIAVGLAGSAASVWFAAKVFRVGLLMFGKPPTLGTLIRWIRMA